MKLFYLDESGNTGGKRGAPSQPYCLLLAHCFSFLVAV